MKEFCSLILDYLVAEHELEKADIASHLLLSREEKIEQGIVIANAEIKKISGREYLLKIEVDNSKVRIGDTVRIYLENKIDTAIARIVNIGIDELVISTDIKLSLGQILDLEIIESVFLQPFIDLLSMIGAEEKTGQAFIEILEGSRLPRSRGINALDINLDAQNSYFNYMQKQVIEEACFRPSVYCIQGPPGTGKTAVLSQIAKTFALAGKEVLVIANTHQAVNNALNKIVPKNSAFNVVKIGDILHTPQLDDRVFIRETYSSYLKERKNLKITGRGDVVGMTLHSSVVNLGLRNSGFKPQIVLVDEAGQIPMPTASIIGSFGCGSIIFIGDDKQMPPIYHPNLIGHPFSISIFQYLCDRYPSLRKTLNVTYRMNDEITSFVSSCFYDTSHCKGSIVSSDFSALRRSDFNLSGINDIRIEEILNCPNSIVAINVTPQTSEGLKCTDSNIFEAIFLSKIVGIFKENKIDIADYAIVTPYRRQVKLIRSLIEKVESPLINTVECLQGQDVETIFISFAASNAQYIKDQIEFLLNPNRLNVMISRAKTRVVFLVSEALKDCLIERFPAFKSKFWEVI